MARSNNCNKDINKDNNYHNINPDNQDKAIQKLQEKIIKLQKRLDEIELIKNAVDASVNPIIFTDTEGLITYGNEKFIELWKYNATKDISGMKISELWENPRDINTVINQVNKYSSFSGELKARNTEKEIFDVTIFATLVNDNKGIPCSIMFIFDDITDHKKGEELLYESEQYLETILQTAVDGFLVSDSSGTIIDVNDSYCLMSGYDREELLGMNMSQIDFPETVEEFNERFSRIIRNGSAIFETRHKKKNGFDFDTEVSATYLGGHYGKFVCFCRDITDRKKTIEELETEKVKRLLLKKTQTESVKVFTEKLAHDYNNILNVILGTASLSKFYAKKYYDSEPMKKIFENMEITENAISDAINLTKKLMEFSDIPEKRIEKIIPEDAKIPAGSGKILFMDDESGNRWVAENMLSLMGYDVKTAENGEEALELYRKEFSKGKSFDAAILDLTVPSGMGAKETIKELLKIDRNIKAIVASGYDGNDVIVNYQKYGFCERIKKPYRMNDLGKILEDII